MHIQDFLQQLSIPELDSHKGQNGKALIIGGSDLFHAASRWSFLATSRLTDMTFYSSTSENNQLLYDAKFYGHDGVIVPRNELENYLEEVDSILIGPGMRRDTKTRFTPEELTTITQSILTDSDWETDTQAVTSVLTRLAPNKKWVIDAGALQIIQPTWIPQSAVLTPHPAELQRLIEKTNDHWKKFFETFFSKRDQVIDQYFSTRTTQDISTAPQFVENSIFTPEEITQLQEFAKFANNATILLKGPLDIIWNSEQVLIISGGNSGMTKGGTGDVLAGTISGLLAGSDPFTSTVVASYLNKLAGHLLYKKSGTMFNSSDLVDTLPQAWKQLTST